MIHFYDLGPVIVGISIPSCLQSVLPGWLCGGRTDPLCTQHGLLCPDLLWYDCHQQ